MHRKIQEQLLVVGWLLLYLPCLWLAVDRQAYFRDQFEAEAVGFRFLVLLYFFLLIFCYGLVIHFVDDVYRICWNRRGALIYGSLVALFTIAPPYFSLDAAGYLVVARNWSEFGANPFITPLGGVAQNTWLQELPEGWWADQKALYGALYLILVAPFGIVSSSLFKTVVLYKIFNTMFFLATAASLRRILLRLEYPPALIVLFLLNPTILIHSPLEGHNDTMMMYGVTLALEYYLADRFVLSALMVALATSIKHFAFVMLPIFFFVRGRLNLKNGLVAVVIMLATLSLGAAVFDQTLIQIFRLVSQFSTFDCFYQCTPFIRFSESAFPNHVQIVTRGVTLFLIAIFTVRFWYFNLTPPRYVLCLFLAPLFFSVYWFSPWYVLPLIPLAVVSVGNRESPFPVLLLLLSGYSLLRYFGF